MKKDLGNGAFEVQTPSAGTFQVNGQRLKHYLAGEKIDIEDPEESENDDSEDVPNASSEAVKQ